MSYRLLSRTRVTDSSNTKNARAIRDNKLLWWPAFSFTLRFRNKKPEISNLSKTYDNSTRRCRRRNRCPDRTSTSNVCSDRSRTEIRPRYNSGSLGGGKQKKKRYMRGGARMGVRKTTTLQRRVQRRGGKTRSLANRDSRVRPRRRDNPYRRRTATLSECRARCRTRNRSTGRLRQETKQRGGSRRRRTLE